MLYTITAINGNEVTLDKQPPSTAFWYQYGIVIDAISLDKPCTIIISNPESCGLYVGFELQLDQHGRLSSDKALRYNEGKLRWSLVDWKSMEPMVHVLEFWASKYQEWNWKKPMDKKQILNSMMRHMVKLMDWEEIDSESWLGHIWHVMANALFYSYHSK